MYRYELLPAYSCLVGRTRRDVPFLIGQKGDGKSRRAGRAAADGAAPRRGHESVSRFAQSPSASQGRPRRRTAKGPEEEAGENREESRQAVALFFCSTSKRGSIGRISQPATGIDTKGARRAERLAEDMIETASRCSSAPHGDEDRTQRKRTVHSLSLARSPSTGLFSGGQKERGRSLHLEIARPAARHAQISASRARTHPPIPAFPLWGRRATVRTMHSTRDGRELMGREGGDPESSVLRFAVSSFRLLIDSPANRLWLFLPAQ